MFVLLFVWGTPTYTVATTIVRNGEISGVNKREATVRFGVGAGSKRHGCVTVGS